LSGLRLAGMGKTIMLLSLILAQKDKPKGPRTGGTLVVCSQPALSTSKPLYEKLLLAGRAYEYGGAVVFRDPGKGGERG
jgi:hypothetical protein